MSSLGPFWFPIFQHADFTLDVKTIIRLLSDQHLIIFFVFCHFCWSWTVFTLLQSSLLNSAFHGQLLCVLSSVPFKPLEIFQTEDLATFIHCFLPPIIFWGKADWIQLLMSRIPQSSARESQMKKAMLKDEKPVIEIGREQILRTKVCTAEKVHFKILAQCKHLISEFWYFLFKHRERLEHQKSVIMMWANAAVHAVR